MQIRLPCATAEDLQTRFGQELAKGLFFVRTKTPKPVGTLIRFDFRYTTGNTALRGLASVEVAVSESDDPQKPGMQLKLLGLEAESHELLRRIGLPSTLPVMRTPPATSAPAPMGTRPPAPASPPPVVAAPPPPPPSAPVVAPPAVLPKPLPRLHDEDDALDLLSGIEPGSPRPVAPAVLAPAPVAAPPAPLEQTFPPAVAFDLPRPPIPRKGPVVGIDLGTTNSCVAWMHHGKLSVIPSREGYNTVPSVVAMSERGRLLVGHPAKSQLLTNPHNTVFGAKRLIGRQFHSQAVSDLRERFPYEIVEGPRGEAAVKLGDRVQTLQEISGLILKEVREVARAKLGQDVTRAVITVPAYYSERQRQAVREAGELAGIYVEQIVNEPTAAALAFGHGRQKQERVLVYDLGGGTFDVSVLELKGNVYEVVSTGGDTFLGGVDFDLKLLDLLLESFEKAHGRPFDGERVALQRMLDAAERAKMALSEAQSFHVQVPFVMIDGDRPLNLDCVITREQLEEATSHLVDRTIQVAHEVLQARNLKPTDIDEVLLVGGQSRMPVVRNKLRGFFGKEASKSVHPDEAVALGAAALAHSIASDQVDALVLVDVLPMSIGVGLPGGRIKRVIERNTKLPHTRAQTIATTKDDQTELEIAVFQGEFERAVENEYLGTVKVDGLPKKPRGAVKIDVTFRLSPESLLTITTREEATGYETERVLATRDTPEQLRHKLADRDPPPPPKKGIVGFFKRLFGGEKRA